MRARLAADHLPGQKVTVVLHDRDDDFVAGLERAQAVAVGDEIQALGGVAGEYDFVAAAGMDEGAYGLAGFVAHARGGNAERIQAAQRIGVILAVECVLGLNDALGALRRGGVVQIGDGGRGQQREIALIIMVHVLRLLVQRTQRGLLKLLVAHKAGKALDGGAGEQVLGGFAVYAAAFKVERRLVVHFADGRAVIALDVFLGAEDQRHGFIDGVFAQHEHGFLLGAHGAGRSDLKVDRAAEYLAGAERRAVAI